MFISSTDMNVNLPWHIIILMGIFFPWLKLPIYILIMKMYYFRDIIYRNIPSEVVPILKSVNDNYFWWHFGAFFGLSLFFEKVPNMECFDVLSIIYSNIVYQTVFLSRWRTNPMFGIFITTLVQYYDGIPIIYALIDNLAAVYAYSPQVFIPEKLAFFAVCTVFDMVRKGN